MKKLKSQVVKCIVVGHDHKSDGRLFYVPKTKSLIGSADYAIDHVPPAGLVFGLEYDGNIDFSFLSPSTHQERPPDFQENEQVYVRDKNNKLQPAHIVTTPFDSTG